VPMRGQACVALRGVRRRPRGTSTGCRAHRPSAAAGVPLAVLSNKYDVPTRRMVDALCSRWTFREVFGERPGVPRKPDPASALALADALGAPPESVAFVGDTGVDMLTARAASMRPVGVLWGFRPEEVLASGAEAAGTGEELARLLGVDGD